MKKLILLSFIGLSVVSCKPTMDGKSQVGLKGNWTMTNVSRIGDQMVKISSFQMADSDCFKGSQWKFVSNNNSGTFALTQGGACPIFESNFKWTISPDGTFGIKFVDQGEKAKKVTAGFHLKVRNQTATTFELVDHINSGTKTFEVVYTFLRN